MMILAIIGTLADDGVAPMTLSGTLSASSGGGTVTSATRTVTVLVGNSGVFTFDTYVDNGVITTTQYSRNGGGFITVSDPGDTEAFTNGDTFAVRTNSVGAGEGRTFNVRDATTAEIIESVSHVFA